MAIQLDIVETPDKVAQKAASIVANLIQAKPNAVLGLATGSTPVPTYKRLVQMHRKNGLSFAHITTFNLDEYVGLPESHEQSYRFFMHQNFFQHIDIPPEQTHIPNGLAPDPDQECEAFESKIQSAGGVDLWLLGIGHNGHIAFNEPGSSSDSRTRLISIAPETITANSRFFDHPSQVPRQALTVGVATILEAGKILLLATGKDKALAVSKAMNGPVSPNWPASALQHHPDCTFILDQEAASLMTFTHSTR
ncbi:MAG: glucosamine-6-phosphate deaminase [bacterium]|nr:glucosamine-6-phosphate deaminase [bacterium]